MTTYSTTITGASGTTDGSGNGTTGGNGLTLGGNNDTVTSTGAVRGGVGGQGVISGNGGIGVHKSGGTLTNAGSISGGAGGDSGSVGGNGGAGVYQASGVLINSGTISGGAGGYGGIGRGGDGGVGVALSTGTVINTGLISGGNSGGAGPGIGGFPASPGAAGAAVYMHSSSTLVNAGTITGVGADAVHIAGNASTVTIDPGAVFNGNVTAAGTNDRLELAGSGTGTISGIGSQFTGFDHVQVDSGATWRISGNTTFGSGVTVTNNGTISQATSDQLTTAGTFTNNGLIRGGAGNSSNFASGGNGGNALNQSGGALSNAGVIRGGNGGNGGITNSGGSGGIGVKLSGGTLTNDDTIKGGNAGAGAVGGNGGTGVVESGGVLINAGTISGGNGAGGGITSAGAGGIGVNLSSGSLHNTGTIRGGSGASANGIGSVGGIGVNLANGGTLNNAGTIGGGAGGSNGSPAGLAVSFGAGNSRLIVENSAVFVGQVKASGSNNTLELDNNTSTGTITGVGNQFIGFDHLQIDASGSWNVGLSTTAFTGEIAGFNEDDSVDLSNVDFSGYTGYSFDDTSAVLTLHTSAGDYTLDFTTGSYHFAIASDGHGGTLVTDNGTPCFCPGSLIATDRGEVAVEALQIGDRVLTQSGRTVPVKWIGRRRRNIFVSAVHNGLPVCIKAGALGADLPCRDLYVSPDHAMLIQGCLVQAIALVNGSSIRQMQRWTMEVEYLHVETEAHEIIFAEGAVCETYLDNDARSRFDNVAEYAQLYPDAKPMVELDLPRICYARQLPAVIRRQIEAIAQQLVPTRNAA